MNIKKLTVPLLVRTQNEIKDGKRITAVENKEFELDVTLNAQMRWEKKFPEQAEQEELLVYAERVNAQPLQYPNGQIITPVLIARLKVLYCYFNFEFPFTDFLSMFDMTLPEQSETLVKQIKEAFEIISGEASEKN